MKTETEGRISERSWVPLGKALAIGLGMFSGGIVVAQALAKIERRLETAELAINERWTVTDMERFGYVLEKNNRQLPLWVPDPRDVKRLAPMQQPPPAAAQPRP